MTSNGEWKKKTKVIVEKVIPVLYACDFDGCKYQTESMARMIRHSDRKHKQNRYYDNVLHALKYTDVKVTNSYDYWSVS